MISHRKICLIFLIIFHVEKLAIDTDFSVIELFCVNDKFQFKIIMCVG